MTRITLLFAAILLTACATTPDPAEVCTAEWVKPRADRAVKELKRDTFSRLKSLASTAAKLQSGDGLSAFQSYRMISSINGLLNDFETSQALKDLKILSSTCDDPQIVKDAFSGMLEEAGVSDKLIELFNGFKSFIPGGIESAQDLIES